jgi:hypothetical protein
VSDSDDWIVPGKNRRLVKPRGADRRVKFGKARREIFLGHLAATCNVTASAAAAGISFSAVYRCRMRDPEFREAWEQALEQGYARLEAALLLRATGGGGGISSDRDGETPVAGADAPDQVDWAKGMELLRHHARDQDRSPLGLGATARRAPFDVVAAKLVKRLKALGVKPEEGEKGAEDGGQPPPLTPPLEREGDFRLARRG